jgi:uncharacterized membrane protein YhhN
MRRERVFFMLFTGVAVLHLAGIYLRIEWLQIWSKPALMPLLALYFIFSKGRSRMPSAVVISTLTALALSWWGDILLMYASVHERFFLMGLVSFLMAHIFYIIDFMLVRDGPISTVRPGFVLIRVVVLLLAAGAIYFLLYPHLGTMTWPVGLYTAAIFAMAFSALLRKGQTREKSFVLVYIGALLFILSDTMIALDRFLSPMDYARLLIMRTCILAQYLIVRGIVAHFEPDIRVA